MLKGVKEVKCHQRGVKEVLKGVNDLINVIKVINVLKGDNHPLNRIILNRSNGFNRFNPG